MTYALALAVGYLLGSIPFGLLLTRAAGGPDIRALGSGHIRATKALRARRGGCCWLRRLPRSSLSGVAQVQRRQGRRRLYRRADRALLAGGTYLLHHLYRGRGVKPLLLARGLGRQRAYPVGVVGPGRAERRGIIPAAERAVVGHAPRQYRPPAQWQRGKNRRLS